MKKKEIKYTRWQYVYGTIAARLYRNGKVAKENVESVSKFLGAFVYVFSWPYQFVKMLLIKCKVAKIKRRETKK